MLIKSQDAGSTCVYSRLTKRIPFLSLLTSRSLWLGNAVWWKTSWCILPIGKNQSVVQKLLERIQTPAFYTGHNCHKLSPSSHQEKSNTAAHNPHSKSQNAFNKVLREFSSGKNFIWTTVIVSGHSRVQRNCNMQSLVLGQTQRPPRLKRIKEISNWNTIWG